MKKKVIISIVSIIFVIALGTTIYAKSAYPNDDLFYSIGKLFTAQKNSSKTKCSEKIYAEGKDITITWDEVNEIKERMDLAELKDSEDSAYRYVLQRKVLLNAAEKAGYKVTAEEVEETIETYKKNINEATNKAEFDALIEGAGGETKYWESLKGTTHTTLMISKYLTDKQKEFSGNQENNTQVTIGENGDLNDPWEDKKEKIIQKLIDEQDIKIVKE